MSKFKVLLVSGVLCIAGFVVGCSDNTTNSTNNQKETTGTDSSGVGDSTGLRTGIVVIPDSVISVSKTEDGNEVIVYESSELNNVITKFELDTTFDNGYKGTLVLNKPNLSKFPDVGDILATDSASFAPYGFLLKVLRRHISADTVVTLEVRQAALDEAIEECDYEEEFDLLADGRPVGLNKLTQKNTKISTNLADFGSAGAVTLDVTYTLKGTFKVKIKNWKLTDSKFAISQDYGIGVNGEIKQEIKKDWVSIAAREPLPTIKFAILWVPVVITNEGVINAKITADAKGSVKLGYNLNGYSEYGVKFNNGKSEKIDDSRFEKGFEVTHSLEGYIKVGALAGIQSKLYDCAGLNISAGPAMLLKATASPFGTHVYDNGFQNAKDNEIFLAFGVDFDARAVFEILGHRVVNVSFANSFYEIDRLFEASLFPAFDNIKISSEGKNIRATSAVQHDLLNYPVMDYGLCLELKGSTQCKDGDGDESSYGPLTFLGQKAIADTFANKDAGDYQIRPWISSGTGTFYGKAVEHRHIQTNEKTSVVYVNIEPYEGGKVYSLPPTSTQSLMQYQAVPNDGYVFINWTFIGDGILSSSTATITELTLYSDTGTLIATFQQAATEPIISTFTDTRDGKVYKKVVIGTQTWMAENLNYAIPNDTVSRCYENNPVYCDTLGRLYPWFLAMGYTWSDERLLEISTSDIGSSTDPSGRQGICPPNWHIPSFAEWHYIINLPKAIDNLADGNDWEYPEYKIQKNTYGFSAKPSGFAAKRSYAPETGIIGVYWDYGNHGPAAQQNERAEWWMADYTGYGSSSSLQLRPTQGFYSNPRTIFGGGPDQENDLMAVRCVQD